jgi:hypothetical protein
MAFLEKLEAEWIIQLPPYDTTRQYKCRVRRKEYEFNTSEIKGEVGEYEPVKLVIATPGEELKRWRAYVEQYHILGDKQVFGSRLQYFVKSGETELGCMQFSASSWSLEERDKWIGWTKDDRRFGFHLMLTKSVLIFPWCTSDLASKHYPWQRSPKRLVAGILLCPVLLETF